MIIARLQGGLGNQMFQYAAAKSLARRNHTDFKLETITSLQKDSKRILELSKLQATYTLADYKEVKAFIPFPGLYRHVPSLLKHISHGVFREKHFHFDPSFFNTSTSVFLDGFWQSPKYFENISEEIRKDFLVKKELVTKWDDKIKVLQNTNSVSVHIRRGDLLNPKAAAYHGILQPSYYENAMGLLRKQISDATFHFFSDDINWVKNNISLPAMSELTSLQTHSAIEDFHLMKNCSHNIIANSSFSWWAAWLNSNDSKKVVAPKNWFAVDSISTEDLIPESWIRL